MRCHRHTFRQVWWKCCCQTTPQTTTEGHKPWPTNARKHTPLGSRSRYPADLGTTDAATHVTTHSCVSVDMPRHNLKLQKPQSVARVATIAILGAELRERAPHVEPPPAWAHQR
jgi:hypothetical protein